MTTTLGRHRGYLIFLLACFFASFQCSCTFRFQKTKLNSTSPETPPIINLPILRFDKSSFPSGHVLLTEGSAVVIILMISEKRSTATTIHLELSGNASASRFSTYPASVVIPPGLQSVSVTLNTSDDNRYQGPTPIDFQLRITSQDARAHQTDSVLPIRLVDNETPPIVSFDSSASSAAENSGSASLAISLSHPSDLPISVAVDISGGSALVAADFILASPTVSFAPGATTASALLTLQDDNDIEASETVQLSLSSPSNAVIGAQSTHVFTITDDEVPLGDFTISGVTSTGGSYVDSTVDDVLNFSPSPILHWTSASGATNYDVTIFSDDESTSVCSTETSASTSIDLSGICTLSLGAYYKARVVAKVNTQTKGPVGGLYRFFANRSPQLLSSAATPWLIIGGASPSSLVMSAAGTGATNEIAIASDADGDSLFVTVAIATVGLGTLSGVGTAALTFAPSASVYGQESISVTVEDTHGGRLQSTVKVNIMRPFTWTGALSSAWSTSGNWCGTTLSADRKSCGGASSAPGASDVIRFDATCSSGSTCAPTTSGAISVGGVEIAQNGFVQGASHAISVGSSGWRQTGGTFSATNTITVNSSGPIVLSGGTFNLGSQTLRHVLSGGATMTALTIGASATVSFPASSTYWLTAYGNCGTITYTLDVPTSFTMGTLTADAYSTGCGNPNVFVATGDSIEVETLKLNGALIGGSFAVNGQLQVDGAGASVVHPPWVTFKGASPSTYKYVSGIAPFIRVQKDAGVAVTPEASTTSLQLRGLDVVQGSFTFPSVITMFRLQQLSSGNSFEFLKILNKNDVVFQGGTVEFNIGGGCSMPIYIANFPADLEFPSGRFYGSLTGCNYGYLQFGVAGSGIFTGLVSLEGGFGLKSNIYLKSNVVVSGGFGEYSTSTLVFNGTSDQSLTQTGGGLVSILVDKLSGAMNVASNVTISFPGADFDLARGTLNLNGYALTVSNNDSTDNVLYLRSGTTLNRNGAGTYAAESIVDQGATIVP